MTKLLNRAIAELKKLSPQRQDELATTLLHLLDARDAPRLTPEQEAEVRVSMAARDFLSEKEVEALYARYGV